MLCDALIQSSSLTDVALKLWAVGSLCFTIDGMIYMGEFGFSAHTLLYTSGSFLFLVGCVIWLIEEERAAQEQKKKRAAQEQKEVILELLEGKEMV